MNYLRRFALIIVLMLGTNWNSGSCELQQLPLKKMVAADGMIAVFENLKFGFLYDKKKDSFVPQFNIGEKNVCRGSEIFGDPFSEQKSLWYDPRHNTVVSYATYGSGESEFFLINTKTCATRETFVCQGNVTISKDNIHCGEWCEIVGGKKECSPEHIYLLDESCRVKHE